MHLTERKAEMENTFGNVWRTLKQGLIRPKHFWNSQRMNNVRESFFGSFEM
jgi:hypothetical protein